MSMRLFIDTNVMLDLLGERLPYYDAAAKIATLADKGELTMVVSALSYSTVYYLLARYESHEKVKEKLRKFKIISEVAEVLITRNHKDFKTSTLPVMSADEFLLSFKSRSPE